MRDDVSLRACAAVLGAASLTGDRLPLARMRFDRCSERREDVCAWFRFGQRAAVLILAASSMLSVIVSIAELSGGTALAVLPATTVLWAVAAEPGLVRQTARLIRAPGSPEYTAARMSDVWRFPGA